MILVSKPSIIPAYFSRAKLEIWQIDWIKIIGFSFISETNSIFVHKTKNLFYTKLMILNDVFEISSKSFFGKEASKTLPVSSTCSHLISKIVMIFVSNFIVSYSFLNSVGKFSISDIEWHSNVEMRAKKCESIAKIRKQRKLLL